MTSPRRRFPVRFLRSAWARLREFHVNQVELMQRHQLVNHPWDEEFLHWSRNGDLHGQYLPPRKHRGSTTRSGWCPGECQD